MAAVSTGLGIWFCRSFIMSRFAKKDWLDLGLKSLADVGPSAIRIDNLCAKAGRTKGSFYHHFKGRDDFVAALLLHWEERLTQAVIDEAEKSPDAVSRLIALNTITTDMDLGVETALRRWAGTDAAVAAAVAAVDKRRIDYVASLLMQAKDILSHQAVDLAVMNYTSLIGFQMMFTDISTERRKRIDRIYVDILDTLPDHK